MQNLLQLILRYSTFWTFVIVEGLCFYMVVQFNQRQGKIFSNTIDRYVSSIYNRYDKVTDYFNLGRQIADVQRENANLRADLTKYDVELSKSQMVIDTLEDTYVFIPASVIGKTFIGRNNTFTIDKGSIDGIEEHMGVISPDGVVGIVRSVNKNYALVMSSFHQNSRISASVINRKVHGSLVWDGLKTGVMKLNFIPEYVEVSEGDTVITSGYSQIFPKGIKIGQIKTVATTESDYYNIEVSVSRTFNGLEHVYVVKDLRKNELNQLEVPIDGQ